MVCKETAPLVTDKNRSRERSACFGSMSLANAIAMLVYQRVYMILIGGLEHDFYFSMYKGIIIPTD